jgi:hypothetical protein
MAEVAAQLFLLLSLSVCAFHAAMIVGASASSGYR